MRLEISDREPIAEAIRLLDQIKSRILVVINTAEKVVGVLTDGDVRKNKSLIVTGDEPVQLFMNPTFRYVRVGYTKEKIAQLFDQKIHSLVVLDDQDKFVKVVEHTEIRGFERSGKCFYARTPARVSLAGGGTDFTNYFTKHGGGGLCVAINRYCYAALELVEDQSIEICSHDTQETLRVESLAALEIDGVLNIIKMSIKHVSPSFGFKLSVYSDFPPGSGLGGSAAVVSSVLGVLLEASGMRIPKSEVSIAAFEIERIHLSIAGGWQDQYSTVFGGVCALEYSSENVLVTPLRLESRQKLMFESSAFLVDTGMRHLGQSIQKTNSAKLSGDTIDATLDQTLINKARSCFQNVDMEGLGKLLSASWEQKKALNAKVSNSGLDRLFDLACNLGVLGGKLLGTGGGGFFFFLAPPSDRPRIVKALYKNGWKAQTISIDESGLQAWDGKI